MCPVPLKRTRHSSSFKRETTLCVEYRVVLCRIVLRRVYQCHNWSKKLYWALDSSVLIK